MNEIQAVLFDLDGTIYVGDHLIDGAKEVIDYILDQQKRVAFLTNNSTKTREQIRKKLDSFGIKAELNDIYTSAFSTAQYLAEKQITNVYCLGTESFLEELNAQKIEIAEDASANCVVVGMTNEIKHEQLTVIREIAAKPNSLFIACNVDGSYPDGSGKQASGCGKVVEMVEQTISRKVDLVIGKPFPFMLDAFVRASHIAKQQIMIVGDSLNSDIRLAKQNGCVPVFLNEDSLYEEGCTVIKQLEELKIFLA